MDSRASLLSSRLAASARSVPDPPGTVLSWLTDCRKRSAATVESIPLSTLSGWRFEPGGGNLVHQSGRFFSVEGLRVRSTEPNNHRTGWDQPILNQRDVAILGLLAKSIDGVLHMLVQAKMEPGNIGLVQLSPTVQSTKSNYQRVHQGKAAKYVEYFADPQPGAVLVDVLQSEQGSWFLGKRNRNVVVETTQAVVPDPAFRWMTLGQLLGLLHIPHVLNMDMRTVLSCLIAAGTNASPSTATRSWLTTHKAHDSLATERIPLSVVGGWEIDEHRGIHQPSDNHFRVMGVAVQATGREVGAWAQPLLAPVPGGTTALAVRHSVHGLQALVRADVRPGYRDSVEIGPTVQCIPANKDAYGGEQRHYLDEVLAVTRSILFDVAQSEEGGRFYQAATRHLIVLVDDDFGGPLISSSFRWVGIEELAALTLWSFQVNIEARSLLLCLRGLMLQHGHLG